MHEVLAVAGVDHVTRDRPGGRQRRHGSADPDLDDELAVLAADDDVVAPSRS